MKELLKRIFLVHKCVSCRKILDCKNFDEAFCSDCREFYLASKMSICPECSQEAEKCRCMPPLLKKVDASAVRKLFFYSKSKASEPQNRLIYYLKRNKSKRVSRAVARELIPIIKAEAVRLNVQELPIVVSAPRSKSAVFEHGFDQSEMICRAIAEISVFEYCNVLKRRWGGREQKALTSGERQKNIKNLIYCDEALCDKIKGKTVILIDDIVTTGATLSACIQLLKGEGAKNVVCVAIASDIKT